MNLFDDAQRREHARPYERLARKALTAYGLDAARLDLVSQKEHALFRVIDGTGTSAQIYALRVYPSGWNRDRILQTLSWLTALRRRAKLPVPEPILTRSGEWMQSHSTPGVSGFHPITLVTWVRGRRPTEWTTDHASTAGARIADLHNHSETYDPPPWAKGSTEMDPDAVLREIERAQHAPTLTPDAREILGRASGQVRSSILELGADPRVAGLIHGNPTHEHILFEGGDAWVVGFSHCRWGHYLYDLASFTLSIERAEGGTALRRCTIDGYRAIRSLPAHVDRHLAAFEILRLLDLLHETPAGTDDSEIPEERGLRRAVDRIRQIIERERDTGERVDEERAAPE